MNTPSTDAPTQPASVTAPVLCASLLLAGCAAEAAGDDASADGTLVAVDAAGVEAPPPEPPVAPETPAAPEPIVLPGPSLAGWQPRLGPRALPDLGPQPDEDGVTHVAVSTQFNAPVFEAPGRRFVVGRIRRGHRLPVEAARGPGCRRGQWYRLVGSTGYVCTGAGFEVFDEAPAEYDGRQRRAEITRPLPFRYGLVSTDGAPRLARPPTAEEAERLDDVVDGKANLGNLVVQRMVGDYFVALDREETHAGRDYFRTVKGHYVRAEDIEEQTMPEMHGEHLGEDHRLPLAFVHAGETEILCRDETGGGLETCGHAESHARFDVVRTFDEDGERWVEGPDGIILPRDAVRIARKRDRPARVSAGEKWAHVNLAEQTFVAYEGDTPVFATLVSTGKPGYTTPAGLWRTQRKYLTRTMRGGNEVKGVYDVEEVPWALYYNRGWAVHGAYWHEEFGNVRSHGCTNLAPADARFVYYWSELDVPDGWHAVTRRQGTWWHFTRR